MNFLLGPSLFSGAMFLLFQGVYTIFQGIGWCANKIIQPDVYSKKNMWLCDRTTINRYSCPSYFSIWHLNKQICSYFWRFWSSCWVFSNFHFQLSRQLCQGYSAIGLYPSLRFCQALARWEVEIIQAPFCWDCPMILREKLRFSTWWFQRCCKHVSCLFTPKLGDPTWLICLWNGLKPPTVAFHRHQISWTTPYLLPVHKQLIAPSPKKRPMHYSVRPWFARGVTEQ